MSVALTDLLIRLSSPEVLTKFQENPRAFLEGVGLSREEEAAVLSGSQINLQAHARSTTSDDPNQQFNRLRHLGHEILAEIVSLAPQVVELLPELHIEPGPPGPEPAIGSNSVLFVNHEGTLLRAVSDI
jgi:hypothetical protein